MDFRFVDEGLVHGVQYVTVVDEEGNPMEYNISLEEAEIAYGWHEILAHPGMVG